MFLTYNTKSNPVKRVGRYTLRFYGLVVRVQATHSELLEYLRGLRHLRSLA